MSRDLVVVLDHGEVRRLGNASKATPCRRKNGGTMTGLFGLAGERCAVEPRCSSLELLSGGERFVFSRPVLAQYAPDEWPKLPSQGRRS